MLQITEMIYIHRCSSVI